MPAVSAGTLPPWATRVLAPNPGPMTLDGTNTWILRGEGAGGCLVVDPGPDDEAHLRAVAEHGPVRGVLITHGHPDHVAGLARFLDLTGLPRASVIGSAVTGSAVIGSAPTGPEAETSGGAGVLVERIMTPGHTADSVSFVVRAADGSSPAVLTGDTILGSGTTVVAWPDGDLGAYLASLGRLAGLGALPVLPGHGPVLPDCAAAATGYLDHRGQRLAAVRAAMDGGARTVDEVVEAVYAGLDRGLVPAARLSVRAQLEYLAGGRRPPR
jgi:glyoxylase-like metal-dependent hydrolase (beta-lactamase superfamily II)